MAGIYYNITPYSPRQIWLMLMFMTDGKGKYDKQIRFRLL